MDAATTLLVVTGVAGVFFLVIWALQREKSECANRERLVGEQVAIVVRDSSKAPGVVKNLIQVDASVVTWRIAVIFAFAIAALATMLAYSCPRSCSAVFFGVFFACVAGVYLCRGHETTHIWGPVHKALHKAFRVACSGEAPADVWTS